MTDLTPTPRLDAAQRDTIRAITARLLAEARQQTALSKKWQHLEAAHIAGQADWASHLSTHRAMLAQAAGEGNVREMSAQLLRLAVVPLGHLFNRLPVGNPGSSRAPAFKPQPVPQALAALIEAHSSK